MLENNVDRGIPALRVALTSQCNLDCEYCPPKGENFVNVKKPLSTRKLTEIIKVFYEIGFRQFGFTGGEPLLQKDLSIILKECSGLEQRYFKLYSNGTLLKKQIDILRWFDLVKLSLDTLNPKKYAKITGKDCCQDVLEGIELARKNKIKLRINTVLTKRNQEEIFDLIQFCSDKKIDLKILDLNCFEVPGYAAWRRLYIKPSGIIKELKKRGLSKKNIYTTGHYGIVMPEFRLNGIFIRIKDTRQSSVYSPVCKNCEYFPCQEGLYHLTLTSDGKLKMCKHRADIYCDLRQETKSKVKERIECFLNKHYFSAKRTPLQKQVFLGYFGNAKDDERK